MPNSLHERIKLINKQNAYRNGKVLEEQEKQSEESLVSTVEKVWADTQECGAVENSVVEEPVTLEKVYATMMTMLEQLKDVTESMAKINKHINATQKMLKKTGEKAKEKKK